MSDNAKVLEILKGISQAASKSFDGAHDEEGKPVKIGLKREVDNVVTQSRTMDGAKCRVQGHSLIVTYQSDIRLQDVYEGGKGKFENKIKGYINDYVSWLKKEYKKHASGGLELTEPTEPEVRVERTSNVRVFVTASCVYTIPALKKAMDTTGEEDIAKERKKKAEFTDQGGHGKEQKGEKNKRGKEPKKESKKKAVNESKAPYDDSYLPKDKKPISRQLEEGMDDQEIRKFGKWAGQTRDRIGGALGNMNQQSSERDDLLDRFGADSPEYEEWLGQDDIDEDMSAYAEMPGTIDEVEQYINDDLNTEIGAGFLAEKDDDEDLPDNVLPFRQRTTDPEEEEWTPVDFEDAMGSLGFDSERLDALLNDPDDEEGWWASELERAGYRDDAWEDKRWEGFHGDEENMNRGLTNEDELEEVNYNYSTAVGDLYQEALDEILLEGAKEMLEEVALRELEEGSFDDTSIAPRGGQRPSGIAQGQIRRNRPLEVRPSDDVAEINRKIAAIPRPPPDASPEEIEDYRRQVQAIKDQAKAGPAKQSLPKNSLDTLLDKYKEEAANERSQEEKMPHDVGGIPDEQLYDSIKRKFDDPSDPHGSRMRIVKHYFYVMGQKRRFNWANVEDVLKLLDVLYENDTWGNRELLRAAESAYDDGAYSTASRT